MRVLLPLFLSTSNAVPCSTEAFPIVETLSSTAGPLSDRQRLSLFSLLPSLCAFSLLQNGSIDIHSINTELQPTLQQSLLVHSLLSLHRRHALNATLTAWFFLSLLFSSLFPPPRPTTLLLYLPS